MTAPAEGPATVTPHTDSCRGPRGLNACDCGAEQRAVGPATVTFTDDELEPLRVALMVAYASQPMGYDRARRATDRTVAEVVATGSDRRPRSRRSRRDRVERLARSPPTAGTNPARSPACRTHRGGGAVIPPGLTCCVCRQPFHRRLARRTLLGWRHAEPCGVAPAVLEHGRWVRQGLVSKWVPA
jgi:hypothetical protein